MKEASKRGVERSRLTLDRLKDPAVVAVLLIIAFGVYSILSSPSSSVTGKAIARPANECQVAAAGTTGVMLLGNAGNFQVAERVLKPNTCGTPVQRPANTLKQFLLLGQSCQAAPDGILTLTLEGGATQRFKSGCATDQFDPAPANSNLLVNHACTSNDLTLNIISCSCADGDCANLIRCEDDAVCAAGPDGLCVDKQNSLGKRCYQKEGTACDPNFRDECVPGLVCGAGGLCKIEGEADVVDEDDAPPVPDNQPPANEAGGNAGGGAGAGDVKKQVGEGCANGFECESGLCGRVVDGRQLAVCAPAQQGNKQEGVGCVRNDECASNRCVQTEAGQWCAPAAESPVGSPLLGPTLPDDIVNPQVDEGIVRDGVLVGNRFDGGIGGVGAGAGGNGDGGAGAGGLGFLQQNSLISERVQLGDRDQSHFKFVLVRFTPTIIAQVNLVFVLKTKNIVSKNSAEYKRGEYADYFIKRKADGTLDHYYPLNQQIDIPELQDSELRTVRVEVPIEKFVAGRENRISILAGVNAAGNNYDDFSIEEMIVEGATVADVRVEKSNDANQAAMLKGLVDDYLQAIINMAQMFGNRNR